MHFSIKKYNISTLKSEKIIYLVDGCPKEYIEKKEVD